MARKYRIKRKQPTLFSRLIPESAQRFIARRVIDATGVSFMALGGFILLAILSYSKNDPSFNSATSYRGVDNWMGASGASISDLLLQTIGLGGALFGIAFCLWGWRLFRRERLGFFALRFVALVFAGIFAAAAFARIPSGDWLVQSYLGGSAGQMMLQKGADLFHAIRLPYPATIAAAFLAVIAATFASFAMVVRWENWKWIGAMAWYGVCSAAIASWNGACAFLDWVRHHGEEDYKPSAKRKKPARPRLAARDDDEDVVLERGDIDKDEEEEEEYEEEEDDGEYEEEEDETSSRS